MNDPRPLAPRLELFLASRFEQVYEFKGPDIHIGRAPGLDICLDNARVSRHHARVEHRSDGSSYIVDLDSKSSTKLNGRKLAPFQPVPLRDGSRIKIVDFELVFREYPLAMPDKSLDGATVLETIDNLSSSHLAIRSSYPTEALEGILEINRALSGGTDLNETLARALDGLLSIFPAVERGFIITTESMGRPRVRAVREPGGQSRAAGLEPHDPGTRPAPGQGRVDQGHDDRPAVQGGQELDDDRPDGVVRASPGPRRRSAGDGAARPRDGQAAFQAAGPRPARGAGGSDRRGR